MRLVLRALEQGDVTTSSVGRKLTNQFRILPKLGPVPLAEGVPFCRIVSEPFAQCVAGREFLHPAVDLCLIFLESPRPEPVDQYAHAVRRVRRIVDSFDSK